jgi:hypothetical protein
MCAGDKIPARPVKGNVQQRVGPIRSKERTSTPTTPSRPVAGSRSPRWIMSALLGRSPSFRCRPLRTWARLWISYAVTAWWSTPRQRLPLFSRCAPGGAIRPGAKAGPIRRDGQAGRVQVRPLGKGVMPQSPVRAVRSSIEALWIHGFGPG